jgi:fructokinase
MLAEQLGQELAQVTSWTAYPGGAPANVACALMKLGTSAAFIGCIGQDKPGDELVALLEQTGVNIPSEYNVIPPPLLDKSMLLALLQENDILLDLVILKQIQFADTQLEASQLEESLFINAQYLVIGTLELAYPLK